MSGAIQTTNPIDVLIELLTPHAQLDRATFTAAAQSLADADPTPVTADATILDILRQIEAVLYETPSGIALRRFT